MQYVPYVSRVDWAPDDYFDSDEIRIARAPTGPDRAGAPASPLDPTAAWRPQKGPQRRFVESDVFEVVYGGARGGGKTDGALGDFLYHAAHFGPLAKGLFVRRHRTALEPTIARARQIFAAAGVKWLESKSRFVWPSGAVLTMSHLGRDADADLFQGHDYTRVYIEELTHFPNPIVVDKLKATLRSAAGAHCGLRATCNPGGVGHAWVKRRYVDPGAGLVVRATGADGAADPRLARLFIAARVDDNRILLANDPDYRARLAQSGSKNLVKAWLEGDWNIVDGAFFDHWSAANIVKPFPIPAPWLRLRAFDWGYAKPFSVGWWAVVADDFTTGSGAVLPEGALVRYREWYGSPGGVDDGLRLDAEVVAAGILQREAGEHISHSVADPSIFARRDGPSVEERMRRAGVPFRPADNTRVGERGALSGWDQVRARIRGVGGRPMLYVFSTCDEFIRTVPALQHDPLRPEDLDTRGEDHIADETRYACMARTLHAACSPPSTRPDPYRPPSSVSDWKSL